MNTYEDTVYPPVLSKRDFSRRYKLGEFGNASPTWETLTDFMDSRWAVDMRGAGYSGPLFHLRNRIRAEHSYYNQSPRGIHDKWSSFEQADWYCSAMAPTEATVIQGEVLQSCYRGGGAGLDFHYNTTQQTMRDALYESGTAKLQQRTKLATGSAATCILRTYLNGVSWDWLNVLLDRYPGHVVELSVYDRPWGTLPGYNTVFWEVRNY